MLDHDTLVSSLEYDRVTGVFRWRVNRWRVSKGMIAGWLSSSTGHRQIRIFQHTYLEHQLAWFYVRGKFPDFAIDHKDGNGSNNAWSNLRRATHSQNGANRGKNRNNTSGFKGVSRHNPSGRWRAQIMKDRKSHCLGLFDDPAVAHGAYMRAARAMFGEFASS